MSKKIKKNHSVLLNIYLFLNFSKSINKNNSTKCTIISKNSNSLKYLLYNFKIFC